MNTNKTYLMSSSTISRWPNCALTVKADAKFRLAKLTSALALTNDVTMSLWFSRAAMIRAVLPCRMSQKSIVSALSSENDNKAKHCHVEQ